jgi:hypothetical protein
MAGVGDAAMLKAVHRLRREGRLDVTRKRGIRRVVDPGVSPAADDRSQPRRLPRTWEKLRDRIGTDVLLGTYPMGTVMPQPKQLRIRYGVSYRTLKKALDALVRQGVASPHGRTYRIPTVSPGQGSSTVVLLARGFPDGRLWPSSPRVPANLQFLESECVRLGLKLARLPFYYVEADMHIRDRDVGSFVEPTDEGTVLGYLLWIAGMEREHLSALMRRLVSLGKPVSLLFEATEAGLRAEVLRNPLVRTCSMALSPQAGYDVGRHLLSLGHRKVAYVSPVHGGHVSQARLAGLRESFRAAGLSEGVCSSTLDTFPDHRGLLMSWEEVRSEIDALLTGHMNGPARGNPALQHTLSQVSRHIEGAVRVEAQRSAVHPLLDSALADRDVTALVGDNDWTALACMHYLREKGVRVPGDLSVVGFDNSPDAFAQELTSYDFGGAAMVRAMLSHVLAPRLSAPRSRTFEPIEIDGFVSVRRSTAAPARLHRY